VEDTPFPSGDAKPVVGEIEIAERRRKWLGHSAK
jgi:hypothetical protein